MIEMALNNNNSSNKISNCNIEMDKSYLKKYLKLLGE